MSIGDGSQLVVLLVRDKPLLEMLRGFFEHLGFPTDTPLDEQERLHLIAHELTCMVIIEDGYAGVEHLVATVREQRPSVPIVMLVDNAAIGAAVSYMRMGVADCLQKPVDLERLGALIKANMLFNVNDTVDMGQPQRQIGGYTLLCEIGGGSMGVIYLACNGEQRVALKVLRAMSDDPEEREEMRERFQREARAAAGIEHPNVVRIHDFGICAQHRVPYIAMALLSGIPLLEYDQRHPDLDFRAKTLIMQQIAGALKAIHEHGICHRDIKPANILVDADGTAVLTDFGVAYMPGSDLTVTGEMIGSPAYMAPEAFRTARIDPRADIFALGVVIYEFFLGRHPFMGRGIAETAANISHQRPEEPISIIEKFPPRLQLMLGKMLRKNPKDRYPDMQAVIDEMQAYLDDLSGKTTGVWNRSIVDLSRAVLKQDWK